MALDPSCVWRGCFFAIPCWVFLCVVLTPRLPTPGAAGGGGARARAAAVHVLAYNGDAGGVARLLGPAWGGDTRTRDGAGP